MGNVNMEAKQIHYRGGDKPMSVEDALKSTAGEAAAIAQLQQDVSTLVTNVGNLQSTKANQITIAPFFSAEASYSVGDLVYYNGLSYKCTTDHTGEWDATDFTATTIAQELANAGGGVVDYSTTEQNTGVKWIDGKDIYKKVITFETPLDLAAQTWTDTGVLSDAETIISAFSIGSSGGAYTPLGGSPSYSAQVHNFAALNFRTVTISVSAICFEYTKETT